MFVLRHMSSHVVICRSEPVLPMLTFAQKRGNATFYEWRTGKVPTVVERPVVDESPPDTITEDTVSFTACVFLLLCSTSKNHSLFYLISYLISVHYVNWAIIEIISKCLHVSKWFQMSTHSRSSFLPLFLLRLLKSVLDRLGRLWQSIRFPGCEFRHHSWGWNRLGNQPGAELQGRASEHVCVASFPLKQW